jgi:hypothetical protein
MRVPRPIRAAVDGLGNYLAGTTACLVLALLAFLLVLQSPPDKLLWTGTAVSGAERGGLVYYRWHGQSYTMDVPGNASKPRYTVYLDPSDPEGAIAESVPRRALDGLLVIGPLVLGGALLGLGLWRRRSTQLISPGGFGTGLDPEVVDKLLQKIRQPPP